MYAYIKGIVDTILADRVVIETCGIGYEIVCSANTLKRLAVGSTAKLFTHFSVSQDAIGLYGFYSEAERTMFRKLISVSRIGPKVSLNVLSVLSPEDVSLAVITDNVAAFDRVQGMGKKTAARVILELKEKVDSASVPLADSACGDFASIRSEAIAALVALGYDGAVAGRAVASIDDCDRVENLITLALRELSKH